MIRKSSLLNIIRIFKSKNISSYSHKFYLSNKSIIIIYLHYTYISYWSMVVYYHQHHHWHNSPFSAKAFFRTFCQLSLFLAAFLQFLSPNFLASSITPSSHLSFGLPLCLLPSTTATRTLLAGFFSSSPITCPAHLRWLTLIYMTI